MASITNVSVGIEKKKVEIKISMNYSEYILLEGSATNVRVFSEDTTNKDSKIRTAGKKGETKYLLVPKEIKKEIKFNSNVTCQYRDMGDKILVFYVIDK